MIRKTRGVGSGRRHRDGFGGEPIGSGVPRVLVFPALEAAPVEGIRGAQCEHEFIE